jgi:hypothetical protein
MARTTIGQRSLDPESHALVETPTQGADAAGHAVAAPATLFNSSVLQGKSMTKRTPIRHGEILLLPVQSAPAGTTDTVTECIVGHSESGHHHVLKSDAVFDQIVAANGDLYVDLDAPTPLRHRKVYHQHRELMVPAGTWKVIRKTEFDVRTLPEPPDVATIPEPLPTPPRRWVRD